MSIRLGGILAGLAITAVLLFWSLLPGAYNLAFGPPAEKQPSYAFYEHAHAPQGGFSFDGAFGKWDYAQLQRGYQVYKEVCSASQELDRSGHRPRHGRDHDPPGHACRHLPEPVPQRHRGGRGEQ